MYDVATRHLFSMTYFNTRKFNTTTSQLCAEIDTSRPDTIKSESFVKAFSFNRGNLAALYFCNFYYSDN